jgi:hypothetical protein
MTENIMESFKCLDAAQQASLLKELLTKETKTTLRKQKKAQYMKQYMASYYRKNDEYAATVRQKGKDAYQKKKLANENNSGV